MNNKEHWNKIYATKAENEVSWFQTYPKTSVEFIELFNLPLTANIIDIGGGDSHLADVLIEKGYQNIWVLDISANAIERSKRRLGASADKVHWIVSDVNKFDFHDLRFDLWHDRAAFHFLTTKERIYKYVSAAEGAIKKNGYLIVATFSEQGPKKCSGLEIKQYSETSMSARFKLAFERIKCIHEDHVTPFNTIQNFLFCSFKRK
ncbi:MAG: class I SAM-dependent methyltransferase [Chitinophagales bacterium]